MKVYRIFFAFLVFCLMFLSTGYSQYFEQYECATNIDPQETGYAMSLTQLGGMYITADGTFRILIVFVSYPDDNNSHPYWPMGEPPTAMANFIDPNVNTNSTNHANLTNYFSQMSFDTYNVIGEAIHVQSPHTKA